MAYTDQTPHRHPVIVTSVLALHIAAAYALISGLGVQYIKDVTTIMEARNIPVDIPSPKPLPEPSATPSEMKKNIPVPVPVPAVDLDRTPIGQPPQPPVPQPPEVFYRPEPPTPVPSFVPAMAKPRTSPATWATTDDYPSRDLREGNQGVTRFSLAIDPQGKVQSCIVLQSSGFAGLDEATCRHVSRRARFDAATDASGNRVSGSYIGNLRWRIPQD